MNRIGVRKRAEEPGDGVIANDYPMNQRSAFVELNYY